MFNNKLDAELYINNSNKCIEKNISLLSKVDIALCSQNILSQSRNLVEALALYICQTNNFELDASKGQMTAAIIYLKKNSNKYNEILNIHYFLEEIASHFTLDEWKSNDVMKTMGEKLFKLKIFARDEINIEILNNLNEYPFNLTDSQKVFYTNILETIQNGSIVSYSDKYNYYIEKKKRIIVKNNVFYEYVVSPAINKTSKFDRITCYSLLDICDRHAINCSFQYKEFSLFSKKIELRIIDSYITSIRPCEFKNLGLAINFHKSFSREMKGYEILMNFLTDKNVSLYTAITNDKYYRELEINLAETLFVEMFSKLKYIFEERPTGYKTIKYLTCIFKNSVIKNCLKNAELISNNIFVSKKCLMFEAFPFCLNLPNHINDLGILYECLMEAHSHEQILQRIVSQNCDFNNELYTPLNKLNVSNYSELIDRYASQTNRFTENTIPELTKDNKFITIKNVEESTVGIIKRLQLYKINRNIDFKFEFDSFLLQNNSLNNLDLTKQNLLRSCLTNTSLLVIKGSAGTGKTTLIKTIVEILCDYSFLFLTNTHSALQNLKRRIGAHENIKDNNFMVTERFIKTNNTNLIDKDVLVIDECSTIENDDFEKILYKQPFKILILVGDEHQIESIRFGNWFGLVGYFFPSNTYELNENHRTNEDNLINIWKETRENSPDLLGHLNALNFVVPLDDSFFKDINKKDEIILCLNYNGLFGINNINSYMQQHNDKKGVSWSVWSFKIDDPILFTNSKTFESYFYNNQKGKILDITEEEFKIIFKVEVDFEENLNLSDSSFVKVISHSDKKIVYQIFINKKDVDNDEDDETLTNYVVPFQLAYAISIHKSQGLEYDSVKIIITQEIDELITYNIFYTAITRAKKELKIYCNEGCINKVIEKFQVPDYRKSAKMLYFRNKKGFDSNGINEPKS